MTKKYLKIKLAFFLLPVLFCLLLLAVLVPTRVFAATDPATNCPGYAYSRGFKPTHGGVDLAKNGGCWIEAAAPGKVIRAGWGNTGEGYYVAIDHGNGLQTNYYHGEKRFAVKVGDSVKAGQPILYMGSTGNSTGTHLHFEIRINGVKVNPELYVKVR